MRSKTETKITFTLTKEEKEILEKAKDILGDMQNEAINVDFDDFDDAFETLYDIVKNIKSTNYSDTYVYVLKKEEL